MGSEGLGKRAGQSRPTLCRPALSPFSVWYSCPQLSIVLPVQGSQISPFLEINLWSLSGVGWEREQVTDSQGGTCYPALVCVPHFIPPLTPLPEGPRATVL